jgi:Cys-tRNA(Pro) deacylase
MEDSKLMADRSMIQTLADLLQDHGLYVEELPDDTGTAELAAQALGVPVARIVKSLVCIADGQPLLIMAAGNRTIDLDRLSRMLGYRTIRMATAREVKDLTGFPVGGVPPLGHATPLPAYFDKRLLDHQTVYAAAGTRHRVFAIAPERLREITQARVVDLQLEA